MSILILQAIHQIIGTAIGKDVMGWAVVENMIQTVTAKHYFFPNAREQH